MAHPPLSKLRISFAVTFVMLIFAISLTNAVVHPGTAFADDESEDSSIDETYKVTVAGAYLQEEARSIQGMINGFRTNKVDYENGNTPWYYDEDGKQVDDGELGVLEWDYDLEQIAIQRAIELAVVFDHTRPNGGSCFTLTSDGHRSYGENIAMGQNSAEQVFVDWREDDCDYEGQGHRRNMLYKRFSAVGIAGIEVNGIKYWVQEFGYSKSDCVESSALSGDFKKQVGAAKSSFFRFKDESYKLGVGDEIELPSSVRGADGNSYTIGYIDPYTGEEILVYDPIGFTADLEKEWTLTEGSDVVEVNGNKIKALKLGKAVFTSQAMGTEVTLTVTVKLKDTTMSDVEWCTYIFTEDGPFELGVTSNSDAKLEYSSSDTSVLKVSPDGVLTPVSGGMAKVTVTAPETGAYAESSTEMWFIVDDFEKWLKRHAISSDGSSCDDERYAPASTKITKLKKAKKSFTVKWKKKSGVTGYQVRYSLKSSMKGAKTVKVKSAKTVSKKVKKLKKKKKKYYVQVRTYKVVNGKTYWSGWSAKKSVKTK